MARSRGTSRRGASPAQRPCGEWPSGIGSTEPAAHASSGPGGTPSVLVAGSHPGSTLPKPRQESYGSTHKPADTVKIAWSFPATPFVMPAQRIDFRHADFENLLVVWRRFYPERYWVTEEVFRRSTVESPLFDWGASCIAVHEDKVVGFVAVKRSAARFYRCTDRDAVHINSIAFDTPEIGLDLMTHVKSVLAERGHTRLVFGQDSDHLFPGCPVDLRRLVAFLLVEGFAGEGQVHDLERNLSDYESPAKPMADAELRLLTKADAKQLDTFLAETFPGRW